MVVRGHILAHIVTCAHAHQLTQGEGHGQYGGRARAVGVERVGVLQC
jgi:hypothetical protein